MGHNPRVLMTDARFETSLQALEDARPDAEGAGGDGRGGVDRLLVVRRLRLLDQHQRAASTRRKLRDVPRWRDSDVYTDLERQVMAYAEAMTATPPSVTDEMVAGLRRELDDAELVELTMMVAVENVRSRFNSALGLTSQGFKDRCEIPAAAQ